MDTIELDISNIETSDDNFKESDAGDIKLNLDENSKCCDDIEIIATHREKVNVDLCKPRPASFTTSTPVKETTSATIPLVACKYNDSGIVADELRLTKSDITDTATGLVMAEKAKNKSLSSPTMTMSNTEESSPSPHLSAPAHNTTSRVPLLCTPNRHHNDNADIATVCEVTDEAETNTAIPLVSGDKDFSRLLSDFQRSWDELSDSDSLSSLEYIENGGEEGEEEEGVEVENGGEEGEEEEGVEVEGGWAAKDLDYSDRSYAYSTLSCDTPSFLSTTATPTSSYADRDLTQDTTFTSYEATPSAPLDHLQSSPSGTRSPKSTIGVDKSLGNDSDGGNSVVRDSDGDDIRSQISLQLSYDKLNSFCSSIESIYKEQFSREHVTCVQEALKVLKTKFILKNMNKAKRFRPIGNVVRIPDIVQTPDVRTIQIEERALEIEDLLHRVLEQSKDLEDPSDRVKSTEGAPPALKKKTVGFSLPADYAKSPHDDDDNVATSDVRSSYSLSNYAGRHPVRGVPTSRGSNPTSAALSNTSCSSTSTGDRFTTSASSNSNANSSPLISSNFSRAINADLSSCKSSSSSSRRLSPPRNVPFRILAEKDSFVVEEATCPSEPNESGHKLNVETSLQPLIMHEPYNQASTNPSCLDNFKTNNDNDKKPRRYASISDPASKSKSRRNPLSRALRSLRRNVMCGARRKRN